MEKIRKRAKGYKKFEAYLRKLRKLKKAKKMIERSEGINKIYATGCSKLRAELETVRKIPPNKRLFYVNYKLTDQGEGEPSDEEEVIICDNFNK